MTRMQRNYLAVLTIAGLLAACGGQSSTPVASRDADVAAVRAVMDRVEQTFAAGDLDAAMTVFTDDAVILGQGYADIVGKVAIRKTYADLMNQFRTEVAMHTVEIEIAGDLAFERGTYTLTLRDKTSGQIASATRNRHAHILKRQPEGGWKTWRMLTNSEAAP